MKKIAIYSGTIPSTTFIERLIKGLSEEDNYKIFLFGALKKKDTYYKNSVVSGYSSKMNKLFRYIYFSILLGIFKYNDKKKLDQWINTQNRNKRLLSLKCYPILWHKPDIFHLQWAKSIEDWIWVQQFGIKLIVSLRGSQINLEPNYDVRVKELFHFFFSKPDAFHAVSNAIAQEAQKFSASPEKIKVIYSGLPEHNLSRKLKTINHTFQILSIGRSHWVKGYHYALDAIKILKEQGFDFHYTIIGAKDSEELEFQKSDLGLKEVVTFKSNVPFTEVQRCMQQADIVLLSSVEEGIANVVLEAMQLGTLVLTTDCGGMSEVIQNGVNGFIVPVRNPQKMAEALEHIMSLSKTEKKQLTEAASLTIEQQHTEHKMVEDMLALYQTVLTS